MIDDACVAWLNRAVRHHAWSRSAVSFAARWLAAVEIALMLVLALAGRRGDAVRMLIAVGAVYAASEIGGLIWPRRRPFARLSDVEALIEHTPERSFPSRHIASGLAMATIGGGAHPLLGTLMTMAAWGLGASRVAAGVHYPTDILGGALLGATIGLALRAKS